MLTEENWISPRKIDETLGTFSFRIFFFPCTVIEGHWPLQWPGKQIGYKIHGVKLPFGQNSQVLRLFCFSSPFLALKVSRISGDAWLLTREPSSQEQLAFSTGTNKDSETRFLSDSRCDFVEEGGYLLKKECLEGSMTQESSLARRSWQVSICSSRFSPAIAEWWRHSDAPSAHGYWHSVMGHEHPVLQHSTSTSDRLEPRLCLTSHQAKERDDCHMHRRRVLTLVFEIWAVLPTM